MSEYTRQFERTRARFGTADLRLEEMYRRGARKRRNEKIGAIVLALVIALASTAAILETLGGSRGPTPASPTITPGNVGQLQPRWTGATGGLAPTPVVTDGVVVTETRSGHVVAFADHCATDGSSCAPLWTAKMDPMVAGTDREDPAITWWSSAYGSPGEPNIDGALTAVDGIVYGGSKTGTIYAFDVHCRTDGQACDPEWTARLPRRSGARLDRDASAPPVVANGLVLVPSRDGTFAFRVGCGTDRKSTRLNSSHL